MRTLETMGRELRQAVRSLARTRGFALAAILAMAVAIGANTAVFSTFDAVVWNALPVSNFGDLAVINGALLHVRSETGVSAPDFFDWQKQERSFTGLAAFTSKQFTRSGQAGAAPVDAAVVTPNFFAVLGAKPLLGRAFSADEAQPGRSHVAVLRYRYWQSAFGGKPGVVGGTIELGLEPYTIIGVMRRGMDFPGGDIWIPLALTPAQAANRADHSLLVLGRLKPGVSLSQGRAELRTIAASLAATFPTADRNLSVDVESLRLWINGNLAYSWSLMFASAMLLVLLIACANVANLQLARGTSRRKEIAVRASLGASRWRVARQMLMESVLLAVVGATLGLLFAGVGIHMIVAAPPAEAAAQVPGWDRIGIDGRALAFTAAVALFAGIVSGLLPALARSKPNLVETLKESGRSTTHGRGRGWLQGALVVAQIALALILLVGTSLMVTGVVHLAEQRDAHAPPNLLAFGVVLPLMQYPPERSVSFYQQALAKLEEIPGAGSAAVFTTPPDTYGGPWRRFQVAGAADESAERASALPLAVSQPVSPNFFAMLRIPLLSGRDFNSGDGPKTLPVAIVSRDLAERYWPGGEAVGRQIRYVRNGKPGPWLTVVGVVGNVVWDMSQSGPSQAIFQPYTQEPGNNYSFVVGGRAAPDSLAPAVRQAIASIDPEVRISGIYGSAIGPLRQAIHESLWPLSVVTGLMIGLGLVAFVLAAIGVYSVTAYAVTERRHEIGVRMALGADSRRVLRLMLRRGAWLALLGVALGLPLSYALAKLLSGLIFGVAANDPVSFAAAILVLAGAVFLASYFPARQAARFDPVETLRAE